MRAFSSNRNPWSDFLFIPCFPHNRIFLICSSQQQRRENRFQKQDRFSLFTCFSLNSRSTVNTMQTSTASGYTHSVLSFTDPVKWEDVLFNESDDDELISVSSRFHFSLLREKRRLH